MSNNDKNKSSPPNAGKTKKVIVATVSLVVLLAVTTFILILTLDDGRQQAFFARDINDASYDCEDKIKSRYDDELVSMSFDNLSSRYEADKRQYLVYYRVSVRENEEGLTMVSDYIAKCIVWERLGYVSDFRVFTP